MQGGADIGAGIHPVQQLHRLSQQIVPGKLRGTKILAGGIQQKDGCGNAHGYNEESGILPVCHVITKIQPQLNAHNTQIPEDIRNDEPFQKGDPVIQQTVHRMINGSGMELLNQQIPQAKYRPEQKIQGILMAIGETV